MLLTVQGRCSLSFFFLFGSGFGSYSSGTRRLPPVLQNNGCYRFRCCIVFFFNRQYFKCGDSQINHDDLIRFRNDNIIVKYMYLLLSYHKKFLLQQSICYCIPSMTILITEIDLFYHDIIFLKYK